MKRLRALILAGAAVASLGAAQAGKTVGAVRVRADVDSARVLEDLRYLASPALAGRAAGSEGNAAARAYIQRAFQAAGTIPFGNRWTFDFSIDPERGAAGPTGSNVIAYVRGASRPDHYIIVTAHYDHLGARNGTIFHGADDNASGTAALLELARYFGANRPANSVIFAALDAEELGEKGATAFVGNPPRSAVGNFAQHQPGYDQPERPG